MQRNKTNRQSTHLSYIQEKSAAAVRLADDSVMNCIHYGIDIISGFIAHSGSHPGALWRALCKTKMPIIGGRCG
jgi:hypothetical protein